MATSSNLLQFLRVCYQLKTKKRTGWVRANVKQPESIADHMYAMSILAFLIDDPTINKEHCIKMALVHDMAESIVGDITPYCGVSKEDKQKMEHDAMVQIKNTLQSPAGEEFYLLWKEYEENTTIEAQLVKQLDKLEMIIQADQYEKEQAGIDLSQFFENTKGMFKHPQVLAVVNQLTTERDQKYSASSKREDDL